MPAPERWAPVHKTMAGISTSSSQSAPHRDGILSKGGAGGEARQEPLPLFTPAAAHLVRDRIVWRSERGQLDRRATPSRMGVLTVGARGSVRGGRSDWGVQRPRPSKLERARAICACALFARSRCAGSGRRVDSLVLLSLCASACGAALLASGTLQHHVEAAHLRTHPSLSFCPVPWSLCSEIS